MKDKRQATEDEIKELVDRLLDETFDTLNRQFSRLESDIKSLKLDVEGLNEKMNELALELVSRKEKKNGR